MYQCRVNQFKLPAAANDPHEPASDAVFAPVEDIIDHCELVSRKFADEFDQMNLNRAPFPRAV